MRAMFYRGTSGCRVIVQFHKPAWSRQPRRLSRIFGHLSPACQASPRPRLRDGGCDLQLRNQGHDLQLP